MDEIAARNFALCCVVDKDPRFHVELILWVKCVQQYLPRQSFRPIAYLVGDISKDLVDWLVFQNIEIRPSSVVVEGSPHCNKIAPFFDGHDEDYTIVSDTDLYFVMAPKPLFRSARFRAAPNNHCHPPKHIFTAVLSASGLKAAYRPGVSLFEGLTASRETHINNINAGFVAAPRGKARQFAECWKHWANWLVQNRALLREWSVNVDQVAFALAMEELKEDVEFLPPQANAILELIEQIDTVYAFHLSTGHLPSFPSRFNARHELTTENVSPGVAVAIEKLNVCIPSALETISMLPSTRPHVDKFLNPAWRR